MKHLAVLPLLILWFFTSPIAAAPLSPDAARHTAQSAVQELLDAFAHKDFKKLATFVGPEGLALSPYVMLHDATIRLSQEELERCGKDRRVRHWGEMDGSNAPIEATCRSYFDKFVWNVDYHKADEVLYNEPRQRGNDINNNHEFAADGIVVELHIRGKSTETELNWKSLRLIFRKNEKGLSLIAITRDVWTI